MDSVLLEYLRSGKGWFLVGSGPSTAMGYPSSKALASTAVQMARGVGSVAGSAPFARDDYAAVFDEVADVVGLGAMIQTLRARYYDLSDVKVTKKQPLTIDRFEEFFRLLPERADSDHSWTLSREEIEARKFDLKAVNPNAKSTEDTRTPEELLDIIEAKGREVDAALTTLRDLLAHDVRLP